MAMAWFEWVAGGVLIVLIAALWWRDRRRHAFEHPGWRWIAGGLMSLILAVPLHAADAGMTASVAFAVGAVLLAWGIYRWVPSMTSLAHVEQFADQLTSAYTRLETSNQELKEKEERFRTLPQSVADGIISIDPDGRIIFWNPGAQMIFGYQEEEVLGKTLEFIQPQRYRQAHREGMERLRDENLSRVVGNTMEIEGLTQDGREVPLEMSVARWTTGQQNYYVAVMRDITVRREAERGSECLQQSRIAISALLRMSLEPCSLKGQLEKALDIILAVPWLSIESKGSIFLTDAISGDQVLTVERGLSKPLLTSCARIPPGYCLCGRAAERREVVYAGHLDHRHDVRFDGIKAHGHYCIPILSQDRLLGILNLYISDGHPEDPDETEFLTSIANTLAGIIERKRIEGHLEHMALHDTLTGLPNRKLLEERLRQDLARCQRQGERLAVMFLDLDKFKQVNDTLGHDVGDQLLIDTAGRLKSCLREGDTVARLGGDEFLVVLADITVPNDVATVARKIIAQLAQPFHFQDKESHIGTSIGIALFPDHGKDPETLLKHADVAMYAVKKRGRNDYCVFSDVEEGAAGKG